jgi:hypothetical protein
MRRCLKRWLVAAAEQQQQLLHTQRAKLCGTPGLVRTQSLDQFNSGYAGVLLWRACCCQVGVVAVMTVVRRAASATMRSGRWRRSAGGEGDAAATRAGEATLRGDARCSKGPRQLQLFLCAHTSLGKEEKRHAAGALGQLQLFLRAHVCMSTQQGECSALMVVLWCTHIQACSRLP